MSNQVIKPDFVDDGTLEEYLEYLDSLRESGVTNMFGAAPYLMDEFGTLGKHQAREVLQYWMRTFSQRHGEASNG